MTSQLLPKTSKHAKARRGECAWARVANLVVVDPHTTSDQQARMPALFCHRERPRQRVDADSFCPDFETHQPTDGRRNQGV